MKSDIFMNDLEKANIDSEAVEEEPEAPGIDSFSHHPNHKNFRHNQALENTNSAKPTSSQNHSKRVLRKGY